MGSCEIVGLENLDLCAHYFAKGPHPRRDELELDVQDLLMCYRRDVYLDLQEEHQVARDALRYLKEVLLLPTLEVIDKEAAWVPIVRRPIEHFELDVGSLASLNLRVKLVFRDPCLLGNVGHAG